jgi:hypothetical protein
MNQFIEYNLIKMVLILFDGKFQMDDNSKKIKKDPLKKAYENLDFLNSNDARALRILAEYYEPLSRLRKHKIKDTVVFYGSARIKSPDDAREDYDAIKEEYNKANQHDKKNLHKKLEQADHQLHLSHYYEQARELAYRLTVWCQKLSKKHRFIVCSGGGPGIMEAANRGAADAGGPTIGMNISIPMEQFPNSFIDTQLSFEFHYFFMRKFWFVYLAKALVVFPGGFGTMDELFDLLTLMQTEKVTKPLCVIVYGKEFWDRIINFDEMVNWGVISKEDLDFFHFVDTVDQAFDILLTHFEKQLDYKKYLSL